MCSLKINGLHVFQREVHQDLKSTFSSTHILANIRFCSQKENCRKAYLQAQPVPEALFPKPPESFENMSILSETTLCIKGPSCSDKDQELDNFHIGKQPRHCVLQSSLL